MTLSFLLSSGHWQRVRPGTGQAGAQHRADQQEQAGAGECGQ